MVFPVEIMEELGVSPSRARVRVPAEATVTSTSAAASEPALPSAIVTVTLDVLPFHH